MKKRFVFSLDEELKPDLTYLIKQAEAEFKKVADAIFNGVKLDEKDGTPAFDIKDLYKEREVPREKTKPNDDFMAMLEQARMEAVLKAADIFKDDF
jgi:tRNA (Thr-GGU) A37 N-methylase